MKSYKNVSQVSVNYFTKNYKISQKNEVILCRSQSGNARFDHCSFRQDQICFYNLYSSKTRSIEFSELRF